MQQNFHASRLPAVHRHFRAGASSIGIRTFLLALITQVSLSTQAQSGLAEGANAYLRGDYRSALQEYLPLARAGDPGAEAMLCAMYSLGQGVPHDYGNAIGWCSRSATQGDQFAQSLLGKAYEFGLGTQQNFAKAAHWYRQAADQGDNYAQLRLGLLYVGGKGVSEDPVEGAHWFRKAGDQGNGDAFFLLGAMYEDGLGVPQDFYVAYLYYGFAIKMLSSGKILDKASIHRSRVAIQLKPMQIVKAEEIIYKWRPQLSTEDQRIEFKFIALDKIFESALTRAAQEGLAALGYEPGPPDGVLGVKTRSAVRAFQSRAGFAVDGVISEELIAALRSARAATRAEPTAPAASPPPRTSSGRTGTGFAVTHGGHVLTNGHVIAGCAELDVRPAGQPTATPATLVGRDPHNDLALLRAPLSFAATATFRDGPAIRPGDSVVVVGHPLRGLLADEANVTTGGVSALAGVGNDARFLQVTAPVQPGNSGGPLLDMAGRVAGVVVAKLDALRVADATGDIPQNVNFAIKAAVAQGFLDANGVTYTTSPDAETMAAADVGRRAKEFTVLIECRR